MSWLETQQTFFFSFFPDIPTLADLIEKDEGHAGRDIVCISAGKVQ